MLLAPAGGSGDNISALTPAGGSALDTGSGEACSAASEEASDVADDLEMAAGWAGEFFDNGSDLFSALLDA